MATVDRRKRGAREPDKGGRQQTQRNDDRNDERTANRTRDGKTRRRGAAPSHSMVEMRNPPPDDNHRAAATAPVTAKTCYFYKDDDYNFPSVKYIIQPKMYRRFDTLMVDLSRKLPGLDFGVRSIYTPGGKDQIRNLDGLTHEGKYICSKHRTFAKGLNVDKVCANVGWRYTRPESGRRGLMRYLKEDDVDYTEDGRKRRRRPHNMATVYMKAQPKKVTVMKNGEPTERHVLLLNRRTAQTFEQVLSDMSDMFHMVVRHLHNIDGRSVSTSLLY
jgi:hypothetical protein